MTSKSREYITWFPLKKKVDFLPYVLKSSIPPIKSECLESRLLFGSDRINIRTPYTGTMSVVLYYRGQEGYLLGMDEPNLDLNIVQLQGAREKGFRIASGLNVVLFMADQTEKIFDHNDSPYERLTMPHLASIVGFVNSNPSAHNRYLALANHLKLKYSQQENLYVRDKTIRI